MDSAFFHTISIQACIPCNGIGYDRMYRLVEYLAGILVEPVFGGTVKSHAVWNMKIKKGKMTP
jgi:hypothetical protein